MKRNAKKFDAGVWVPELQERLPSSYMGEAEVRSKFWWGGAGGEHGVWFWTCRLYVHWIPSGGSR